MLRKVAYLTAWISIIVYMVIALGFVSGKTEEVNCQGISVDIVDYDDARFINEKDVKQMLDRHKFKYIGQPLEAINTMKAESLLYRFPSVKTADAFTTIDGSLNVRIEQREPMIRVVNKHGQSYYIDMEGYLMPLSEHFSAYTIVANGNIEEPFRISRNQSIIVTDTLGNPVPKTLSDQYRLTEYINNDNLWKAQFEQIYVNGDKEYMLIPRVGPHVILFGTIDKMEKKFSKLRSIYKVMNTIGWNKYKLINLKYKNQVVCTKR